MLRPQRYGWSDHHLMHYSVTMGAFLHIVYILHVEGFVGAPWPFSGNVPSCR